MAIQNSFNQLLGVTAGAAGLVKHTKQQNLSNKLNAMSLAETINQKDVPNLQAKNDQLVKEQANLNKDVELNQISRENLKKGLEASHPNKGPLTNEEREALTENTKQLADLTAKQEKLSEKKEALENDKAFYEQKKDLVNKVLKNAKLQDVNLEEIPEPITKSDFEKNLENDPIAMINKGYDLGKAERRINSINQKIEAKKALKYDPEKRKGGLNNE